MAHPVGQQGTSSEHLAIALVCIHCNLHSTQRQASGRENVVYELHFTAMLKRYAFGLPRIVSVHVTLLGCA
jgi:hypothetical protein